jgi:hypothetical protein
MKSKTTKNITSTSNEHQGFINPEFNDLFEFSSNSDEIRHEAKMIMFRFLSEIEKTYGVEKRGLKSTLANSIKKSASFITQIFNGDKIVNLITLAKFQKALKIKFKITAYAEDDLSFYEDNRMVQNIFLFNESFHAPKSSSVTAQEIEQSSISHIQIIKRNDPVLS